MKKSIIAVLCGLAVVSNAMSVYAVGISEWYKDKSESVSEVNGLDKLPSEISFGTDNSGFGAGALQYAPTFVETPITSPLLAETVVGRTVIPEGWSVQTKDLTLDSESITCPNAVWVTVTSPDGKCRMTYISRREFLEKEIYLANARSGDVYDVHSEEEQRDTDSMMHTLNYREAPETCDYMAGIIYEGSPVKEKDVDLLGKENASVLSNARSGLTAQVQNTVSSLQQMGMDVQLLWTDFSMGARTYRDGDKKITMFSSVSAYKVHYDYSSPGFDSWVENIYWDMNAVYGLWTDSADHERYADIFAAFISCTSVSQEFEALRSRNADELQLYWYKVRNEPDGNPEEEYEKAFEQITRETVESGSTYDAMEAWDDIIRDVTDYTTSDGAHIKLPDNFEHVFEGDDGAIYAGDSPDGPYGSTELFPSEIGQ